MKWNNWIMKIGKNLTATHFRWAKVFWSIVIGIVILIIGWNYFSSVDLDLSIWSAVQSPAGVYLFIVGLLSTVAFLPEFVFWGVTRRHFFLGNILCAVTVSALFSLIIIAGHFVEQVVFSLNNLTHELSNPYFAELSGSWIGLGLFYFIYSLGHFSLGWMVGSGFYRLGWKGAVPVILPLAILLNGLFEAFIPGGWGFTVGLLELEITSFSLAFFSALGLIFMTLILNCFLMRDVRIK